MGFVFVTTKRMRALVAASIKHLLRRLHEQINLSNRLFEQGSRTNSLPGFLAWTKIWETLVTKVLPTWQGRDVTSVGNLPSYYSTYPDRNRKRMKSLFHPETLTSYSTSIGKWLSLILLLDFHTTLQSFGKNSPRNTCLLTIIHDYVFQSFF